MKVYKVSHSDVNVVKPRDLWIVAESADSAIARMRKDRVYQNVEILSLTQMDGKVIITDADRD